jgi:predicted secreted protein
MRLKLGSLQNCLADNSPSKELPKIGSGATICGWTDRHPVTVVGARFTKSGKMVVEIQYDFATRTDKNGMSESQTYEYTPNPDSPIQTFRQRKDGVLRNQSSQVLSLGAREKYYDFSF